MLLSSSQDKVKIFGVCVCWLGLECTDCTFAKMDRIMQEQDSQAQRELVAPHCGQGSRLASSHKQHGRIEHEYATLQCSIKLKFEKHSFVADSKAQTTLPLG
jgi:hypothetical protein